MKEQFQGRMLRIHLTEADRWQSEALYRAIVVKCRELGIAGATAFRASEGFGSSAAIHRSRSLSFSSNAPITVSIIDTEEQIQKLLPHLEEMIDSGMIAVSTVDVIRYRRPQAE